MMGLAVFVLVGLVLGDTVATQTAPGSGLPAQPVAAPRQKNPYRSLFQSPPLGATDASKDLLPREPYEFARRQHDRAATRETKVVCGMLIVPADPSIDPGILIDPTAATRNGPLETRHTLRSVTPTACRPE